MLFKNDIFEVDGQPYRLLSIAPSADEAWVIACEDKYAWPKKVPWSGISGLEANTTGEARPPATISESSLTVMRNAMTKLAPLLAHGASLYDDVVRFRLIKEHAAAFEVSIPALYKWLRAYWQRGQTEMALLPGFKRCGMRTSQLTAGRGAPPKHKLGTYQMTSEDIEKLDDIIKTHYLADERVSLAQSHERLLERHYSYLDGNKTKTLLGIGKRPSYRQLRHYLKSQYSAELIIRKRKGDKEFELTSRGILGTVMEDCLGVGHMFECDATIADVLLVASDDILTIVGKPTLYIIIDRYSRLIVGWYVGLENPSWICAKEAILTISEDKRSICERYRVAYQDTDWPAHQVFPTSVLVDLGEWNSKSGLRFGHTMATTVSFVPSRRADWKPVVESNFKQIRATLQDGTPGFDPPENAKKRQGRHYEKDACLTLHQFSKLVLELIIQHNRTPLRGFPLPMADLRSEFVPTPINVWNKDIATRSGVLNRYSFEHARMQLLPRDEASVTEHGIEFMHCLYTTESAVANGWFSLARQGRFKVEVSFDHRLVDNVFVHDPNGRAEPFLCELSSRSKQHRGRSFAEVKVYHELEAASAPSNEMVRLQAAADYHEATKDTVANAKSALAAAPKKSRTARKASIKPARDKEKTIERQVRGRLKPPTSAGPLAPVAEVFDLASARARNGDQVSDKVSQTSSVGSAATAAVASADRPLSLAEKARLARERLKGTTI